MSISNKSLESRKIYRTDDFTDSDIKQIAKMAELGLPYEMMSAILGFSHSTFERRIAASPEAKLAMHAANGEALSRVAETAYQMAISGQVPAMTMFYLKTRGKWKEVNHTEVTFNPAKLTDDELKEVLADLSGEKLLESES